MPICTYVDTDVPPFERVQPINVRCQQSLLVGVINPVIDGEAKLCSCKRNL